MKTSKPNKKLADAQPALSPAEYQSLSRLDFYTFLQRCFHELHPDGELHLFPDSHFMLLSPEKTDRLAAALVPFLERHRGPEPAPPRSRVVWYDETGTAADAPPELPRRRMWPAGAQLGVAFVAAAVSPVPGCVLTGILVGCDRIDPFAGWLGCLFGGFARRAATGPRTRWALVRSSMAGCPPRRSKSTSQPWSRPSEAR